MAAGFRFALEAIKIDKRHSKTFFRFVFVFLIAIRFWALSTPLVNRNFDALYFALSSDNVHLSKILDSIQTGHWWGLGLDLACLLLAVICSLHYGDSLVLESRRKWEDEEELSSMSSLVSTMRQITKEVKDAQELIILRRVEDGDSIPAWVRQMNTPQLSSDDDDELFEVEESSSKSPPFQSAIRILKKLPMLILLILCMIFIFPLSAPFFAIPFIVILLMHLFTPFYILEGSGTGKSLNKSRERTRGFKFVIFLQAMTLYVALGLAHSILSTFFIDYMYSMNLVDSLFFAFRSLATGRLWTILYLIYGYEGKLRFPNSQL